MKTKTDNDSKTDKDRLNEQLIFWFYGGEKIKKRAKHAKRLVTLIQIRCRVGDVSDQASRLKRQSMIVGCSSRLQQVMVRMKVMKFIECVMGVMHKHISSSPRFVLRVWAHKVHLARKSSIFQFNVVLRLNPNSLNQPSAYKRAPSERLLAPS